MDKVVASVLVDPVLEELVGVDPLDALVGADPVAGSVGIPSFTPAVATAVAPAVPPPAPADAPTDTPPGPTPTAAVATAVAPAPPDAPADAPAVIPAGKVSVGASDVVESRTRLMSEGLGTELSKQLMSELVCTMKDSLCARVPVTSVRVSPTEVPPVMFVLQRNDVSKSPS